VEQAAEPELFERPHDTSRPLVFLDTNAIIGYLEGDPPMAQLFFAEPAGQIRLAINPIVLQELLLTADATGQHEFQQIRDHLRVLPVDFPKAEALLPRIRSLRNRLAHSNHILILSRADHWDFLDTSAILRSSGRRGPTPENLAVDAERFFEE